MSRFTKAARIVLDDDEFDDDDWELDIKPASAPLIASAGPARFQSTAGYTQSPQVDSDDETYSYSSSVPYSSRSVSARQASETPSMASSRPNYPTNRVASLASGRRLIEEEDDDEEWNNAFGNETPAGIDAPPDIVLMVSREGKRKEDCSLMDG